MASPSGAERSPPGEISRPGCQMDVAPQKQPEEVDCSRSVAPPEQRGGYDCDFVETPRELQTDCPICLVVLREPLQVTCCGNSFCRTCIERIETGKKPCPMCNEVSFSTFPNKGLQRSLYSFRVRCVNQKSGCEWTGELRELDGHLNLNPKLGKQLIGCRFAAVPCTHCCEYFQRRNVHAHESESCPQHPFSCDYCENYGSVYEDVVNNHWPVCKCYPVPCPNECGMSPERQNVETHVNTACLLTVVNCDFHYAGCEVQLVRKNMATHVAESLAVHISLLTTQTQMLAGGACGKENLLPHLPLLVLHNQQLTQLTLQLKESLEELKKVSEASKHEVEKLKNENQALKEKVNKVVEQEMAKLQGHLSIAPIKLIMRKFKLYRRNHDDWDSPPFYTHPRGYKMCLSVVANGDGKGKGTHISVFIYLMRGEFDDYLKWPFQGSLVLQLCNQLEDREHCGHTINFRTADPRFNDRVTRGERADGGWGTQLLITHNDLNLNPAYDCQYLKDDCLHFRIIAVDSLEEPGILPTELTMINFEQHKRDNDEWISPPFYTHQQGYKMCLDVRPNGTIDGKGTHVSVYASLMRGEFDAVLKWPFQGHITVAILNQLEDSNHTSYIIPFTITENKVVGRVIDGEMASLNVGYSTFISHTDLNYKPAKNCQYLKHDCLRFQICGVKLK